MLKQIKLKNILSFKDATIELRPLNVLIGINGSGKSNLLEAISLLQAAPNKLIAPIRKGGGVNEWIWKNSEGDIAAIEVTFDSSISKYGLIYTMSFVSNQQMFKLAGERIESLPCHELGPHYDFNEGQPLLGMLNDSGVRTQVNLHPSEISAIDSILSMRNESSRYPEIVEVSKKFSRIRIYRDWIFGEHSPLRQPQPIDVQSSYLEPDLSNMFMVLDGMKSNSACELEMLAALAKFDARISDYKVIAQNNSSYLHVKYDDQYIPHSRLSDGTLRFISLLAVLCNPNYPELLCIEEPELGIHPDAIPLLAGMIKKTSLKCQLLITTHSDIFIDCLTDCADAVLVAEKTTAGGTALTRLNIADWESLLEKYGLDDLWASGDIGGNRW
jgi:predicted ATPase